MSGEPLVIASADGVIQAVSEEASAYGVRCGQSATSARALCRGLIVLPYDKAEYEQAAEALWDVLAVESSVVQPASPEICYVEMTGPGVLGRTQALASGIAQASSMAVHVGLGSTKLVARRAAFARKFSGFVEDVPLGYEQEFLAKTKLGESGSVDSKLVKELGKLGVETFGDLGQIPKPELERKFRRFAYRLSRLLVGEDDDPVRAIWPPPKIECCYVFEDETSLTDTIHASLKTCCERIAADLLSSLRYCRTLSLTVQMNDSSYIRESESLTMPSHDCAMLLRGALRLLKRLHLDRPILDVRLAASDLDGGSGVQLALLDDNDSARNLPHERKHSLEATLRHLRRKHGYSIVMPGSLLIHARRVGFWTHYLAKLKNEKVSVAVNSKGEPVRYKRLGRRGRVEMFDVRRVIDRWKESSWSHGTVMEAQAFRVTTEPDGTYELCRIGEGEWRLRGIGD